MRSLHLSRIVRFSLDWEGAEWDLVFSTLPHRSKIQRTENVPPLFLTPKSRSFCSQQGTPIFRRILLAVGRLALSLAVPRVLVTHPTCVRTDQRLNPLVPGAPELTFRSGCTDFFCGMFQFGLAALVLAPFSRTACFQAHISPFNLQLRSTTPSFPKDNTSPLGSCPCCQHLFSNLRKVGYRLLLPPPSFDRFSSADRSPPLPRCNNFCRRTDIRPPSQLLLSLWALSHAPCFLNAF